LIEASIDENLKFIIVDSVERDLCSVVSLPGDVWIDMLILSVFQWNASPTDKKKHTGEKAAVEKWNAMVKSHTRKDVRTVDPSLWGTGTDIIKTMIRKKKAETAQVFVRDSVIYRGSTVTACGQPASLYLGYAGNASPTVIIESPFKGTIVAPRAQLFLQSLNGTGVCTGEFFANQVVLSPHATANPTPFSCTATCLVGYQ